MTKGKTILLLGGGAAVLATVAGIAYYKYAQNSLDIMPSGINVQQNGDAMDITLKFLVTNNTGLSFTIKSTSCNVFLNNSFLGTAIMQSAVTIPDMSKTELTVVSSFNKSNVVGYGLSVLSGLLGGGGARNFVISGHSKVTVNTWLPITVNVPINETYSM